MVYLGFSFAHCIYFGLDRRLCYGARPWTVKYLLLFGKPRKMGSEGGIFSPLVGTIYFTLLTMLLAIPVGVGAAVYLSEFTREGPLVRVIRFFSDALAGIPSIVIGLFGFAFFVVLLEPITGVGR